MVNFHHLLVSILFGQVISVVGSYSYTLRPNEESRCGCNYSEIYTTLPHFMKSIARDDRFSWVFQGKPGERGSEGPIGPPGLPGRHGQDAQKGEPGEPGRPGLPGESAYRGWSEKGDPGEPGRPGRHGLKGSKGEAGTPFATVLRAGSYIEIKGEKGEHGKRGRRGLNGDHGLPGPKGDRGISIQGEKGAKGEPMNLPDIELLKGPPGQKGEQGRDGARGRSGPCCGPNTGSSDFGSSGPFLIPMPGPPGISITGEKGDKGDMGPAGTPPEFTMVPGASIFKTEADMRLVRSNPGTICFIEEDERAFIRVKNGWKEIPLGNLRLDRPDNSQSYSVAESQPLDPSYRHYLNDVEEKPYYREKIRNANYLKRYRHGGKMSN